MNPLQKHSVVTLGVIALVLAGCGGQRAAEPAGGNVLANVSLSGSPNPVRIGPVDPHIPSFEIPVGGTAVIAAFRARECGQNAPGFEKMMRRQIGDGLQIPNGIVLYDAGIGHYTSKRCGAPAQARAIGVHGSRPGTYEIPFFGGKTTKTVRVR